MRDRGVGGGGGGEKKGATVSPVNLGTDRGGAGAGAPVETGDAPGAGGRGGRGEGKRRQSGPRETPLHAPLTRRCHRYLLLKLSYPLIHARLNAYNFGYDYRAP